MQRDPLKYDDGSSMYQYAGSSPLQNVDPSGLACGQTIIASAVATATAVNATWVSGSSMRADSYSFRAVAIAQMQATNQAKEEAKGLIYMECSFRGCLTGNVSIDRVEPAEYEPEVKIDDFGVSNSVHVTVRVWARGMCNEPPKGDPAPKPPYPPEEKVPKEEHKTEEPKTPTIPLPGPGTDPQPPQPPSGWGDEAWKWLRKVFRRKGDCGPCGNPACTCGQGLCACPPKRYIPEPQPAPPKEEVPTPHR
jgi:hypothetical protein